MQGVMSCKTFRAFTEKIDIERWNGPQALALMLHWRNCPHCQEWLPAGTLDEKEEAETDVVAATLIKEIRERFESQEEKP